jgi:uncharacterized protein
MPDPNEFKTPWVIRVDADACPVTVRMNIEIQARSHQIGLIFYTDDSHELYPEYGEVRRVGQGHDAVDLALVNQVRAGDIVITQDYGLAALALGSKATVIHPGGMLYTDQNIDSLLADRHMAARARKAGERYRQPKRRKHTDDVSFAAQLKAQIAGKLVSG